MSSILGHSHPEICEVVADQMGRLDHLLSTFISEPVADLADQLTSLMPDPLDKVSRFQPDRLRRYLTVGICTFVHSASF